MRDEAGGYNRTSWVFTVVGGILRSLEWRRIAAGLFYFQNIFFQGWTKRSVFRFYYVITD